MSFYYLSCGINNALNNMDKIVITVVYASVDPNEFIVNVAKLIIIQTDVECYFVLVK